jgi:cathepsin L
MRFILSFCFMFSSICNAQSISVETDPGVRKATGYLGLIGPSGERPHYREIDTSLRAPESFDWREEIAMPPVRNQGQCGSCYAFGMTRSLETAELVQWGVDESKNLSEQQIVSCAKDAYGCNGGFMTTAAYLVSPGLALESSFPYTARNSKCKSGLKIASKAKRYALIGERGKAPTVEQIKAAIVKYGPVFVTVSAGGSGWGSNGKSVTGCKNRGTNHIVNIVGWDNQGNWIMNNSWGTSWKDGGYAKIKFGCDQIGDEAGFIDLGPLPID